MNNIHNLQNVLKNFWLFRPSPSIWLQRRDLWKQFYSQCWVWENWAELYFSQLGKLSNFCRAPGTHQAEEHCFTCFCAVRFWFVMHWAETVEHNPQMCCSSRWACVPCSKPLNRYGIPLSYLWLWAILIDPKSSEAEWNSTFLDAMQASIEFWSNGCDNSRWNWWFVSLRQCT